MGILVADGSDATLVATLRKSFTEEGSTIEFVAPKVGGVALSDGEVVAGEHAVDGGPSVLFEAVAIVVPAGQAAAPAKDPAVRDFVSDDFSHCKFIGTDEGGSSLLEGIGLAPDDSVIALGKRKDTSTFLVRCRSLRHWPRENA